MEKTLKICRMALLFAAACALSWAESIFPMPSALVGVKLGLSNIVIMYCLFCIGKGSAFALAVLKALFALLTRGPVAGLMSLSGGVVSIVAMLLALWIFKDKITVFMTSVIGGILHNCAQLTVACMLTGSLYSLYYFPVLLLSGTAAGAVTGIVLKIVLPALKRIKA